MSLQYGYKCWCSFEREGVEHIQNGDEACDVTCLGDVDATCGTAAKNIVARCVTTLCIAFVWYSAF